PLTPPSTLLPYTTLFRSDLLPSCQRIRPILEESPEFPAAVAEPVRLAGALALNRVSFRYAGQAPGEWTLDDVSLQVRPGEFVARSEEHTSELQSLTNLVC